MRRTVLTLSLLTAVALPLPALAQVVVGGEGNSSVIVDYSVLGMPGGSTGYPSAGYGSGTGGLLMPDGTAPRSRIVAPQFTTGTNATTVIGGNSPSPVRTPTVGSGLTPEAMALLGGQASAPAAVKASPKPKVRATPPEPAPAPAQVAKVEPKIEVTRPVPPKPKAPEEPMAAPPPDPVSAETPAPSAPAAPETAPTPPVPPVAEAAPAPPAPAPPAPPAPEAVQVAKAEPGPAAPATGSPDSVVLNFAVGEARLPSEGIPSLEQIAKAAAEDESLRIQLLAYASADGGPSSTARRISLKRALNVRKFLIDMNVRASRIDVRALGNRVPDGNPDRVDISVARR